MEPARAMNENSLSSTQQRESIISATVHNKAGVQSADNAGIDSLSARGHIFPKHFKYPIIRNLTA
jgi:hypothetical protein